MDIRVVVTTYQGPAGDHDDRAMDAVVRLGEALGRWAGAEVVEVGAPSPSDPGDWRVELERCRASLDLMADRVEAVMSAGQCPVSAITRCAVALATLPVVLRHRPDAVVVWFDAHADINTPADTGTGYLGGMALSGPLGWWDSGLGGGLPEDQAVLVGCRDIDPAEQARIAAGSPVLVAPGVGVADRLAKAVRGRPVYVHLDCDVMEPGLFSTDYRVPGGLTLPDLEACARVLGESEVVGVEIAEYEGDGSVTAEDLVESLSPVLFA